MTPPSEMVERVARALLEHCEREGDFDPPETWESAGETGREFYRREARAAIEAMREPTEAMLDAADMADTVGQNVAYTSDGDNYTQYADAGDHWEAMIDAALKDSP